VDFDVAVLDVDVDIVINNGADGDGAKTGMPLGIGIEGRNAHQAVHAAFRFQPAIGAVSLDLDHGGFYARDLAVLLVQHLDLVAALFGPAQVHAIQHARPVAGFGAASAGVDLQVGVVAVHFA